MKGVSPVISAALLLLMAVGIAASAYFWMTSVQGSIETKFSSTFEQSSKSLDKAIEVVYANCLNESGKLKIDVLVTNAGTVNIKNGNWIILIKNSTTSVAVNVSQFEKSDELAPSKTFRFIIYPVKDIDGNNITYSGESFLIEVRSPAQTTDQLECSTE